MSLKTPTVEEIALELAADAPDDVSQDEVLAAIMAASIIAKKIGLSRSALQGAVDTGYPAGQEDLAT